MVTACLDVNRDDVSTTALQTDLTLANVDTNDSSVVEALLHHEFHLSAEEIVSPELAQNDSSSSMSTEKVNKLKLMQHGSCRYNEVSSLCTKKRSYSRPLFTHINDKNCSLSIAYQLWIKNCKNHKR